MQPLLVELRREVLRGSFLAAVATFTTLVAVLALVAAGEPGILFDLTFLVFPVLLLPWTAHLLTRDRSNGMAEVQAASAVRRHAQVLAKATAAQALLLIHILVASCVSWMLLTGSGERAFLAHTPYILWAWLIGTASIAAGLAVGVVHFRRIARSLAVSFGVAAAWIVLAIEARAILALAAAADATEFAVGVLHLSPLTWAYDSLAPLSHPLRPVEGAPAAAPVFALILGLAGAGTISYVWLQDVLSWTPTGRAPAVGLVLALLGLSIGIPMMWPTHVQMEESPDIRRGPAGLTFDFEGMVGGGGPRSEISDGSERTAIVRVTGAPHQVFALEKFEVSGPQMKATASTPIVSPVQLDANGSAELRRVFTLHPDYSGGALRLEIRLVIDGEDVMLSGWLLTAPREANGLTTGVLAVIAVATTWFGAAALPKRWNRQ